MSLQVLDLPRVFKYKEKTLKDPNKSMSPREVIDFYSDEFPELVSATLTGPKINEKNVEFSFDVKFKQKG